MIETATTVRDLTPPPSAVRARMGELYRELRLLRRLKHLAEQAREVAVGPCTPSHAKEVQS